MTNGEADCMKRRRERAHVNVHVAAARPSRVKVMCRAYDHPEAGDQSKIPYMFFT